MIENNGSPIIFEDMFLSDAFKKSIEEFFKLVFITDTNVEKIYAGKIKNASTLKDKSIEIITIPAGEAFKNQTTKTYIEETMLDLGCGRDTLIIAVGGGVVTDIAGFVAATFCRGVPIIYVPTSLLAMVDAAIGGKTAINTKHGKNLIGTFSLPKATFIDVNFLSTLPDAEYKSALSEIIKHALIYDADYFHLISTNINKIAGKDLSFMQDLIFTSCKIKSQIVAKDAKETNIRQICNFGHTIAHAVEKVANYKVSHGDAVAIGIVIESYLSMLLGHLSSSQCSLIHRLIKDFKFKQLKDFNLDICKIIAATKFDKKSRNKSVHIVLLNKIGEVYSVNGNFSHPIEHVILEDVLNK